MRLPLTMLLHLPSSSPETLKKRWHAKWLPVYRIIPSRHMAETYRDLGMNQPEGTVRKEIPVPLTVPRPRLLSVIPQEQNYEPSNNLPMDVLKGILDLVYTEKVREEQGGTYGVSINATSQKRPDEKASLLVAFECDRKGLPSSGKSSTMNLRQLPKTVPVRLILKRL